MPNRSVLNKYALFTSELQKIKKKKELSNGDLEIVDRARLFALLSSSHCWHVYRFIHGDPLNKEAIADEVKSAINESWKDLTEDEMREVINEPVQEHAFSLLLMESPLSPEERKKYQSLLPKLKEEFADGLEPITKEETA